MPKQTNSYIWSKMAAKCSLTVRTMLTKTVDFSDLLPSTKPIDAKTVCTWYEDAEKLLNELKGCNLKEVSENDVAIIRYLQNYKEQF